MSRVKPCLCIPLAGVSYFFCRRRHKSRLTLDWVHVETESKTYINKEEKSIYQRVERALSGLR